MGRKRKKYRAPKARQQNTPAASPAERVEAVEEPVDEAPRARVARTVAFNETEAFPPNGLAPFWQALFMVPVVLVCILPPFIAPYGVKFGYTPDLHISSYAQVVGLFSLSLFALTRLKHPQLGLPRSAIFLPVVLFVAWAALSTLWARSPYHSIMDTFDWTNALMGGLLVLWIVKDMGKVRILLACIATGSFLMATLGVGQYLFALDLVPQFIAPGGTFNNKNMFGQFVIITAPTLFVFFLVSRRAWAYWLLTPVLAVTLGAIFYSYSRGTWLALTVQVVVTTLLLTYLRARFGFNPFPTWSKKIAAVVLLAMVAGMAYLTPQMFIERDEAMAVSSAVSPHAFSGKTGYGAGVDIAGQGVGASGHIRLAMWGNSLYMIWDHFLLGVGLGNWTVEYDAYQSKFTQDPKMLGNFYHANAHNDYVEIFAELGVIGFGLFLWILYCLFHIIKRILVSFRPESIYMVGLIIGLSGTATNALSSFPLKQPTTIMLVIVYTTMLTVYAAGLRRRRAPTRQLKIPLMARVVAVGLIPLLTATSAVAHVELYKAEIHYRRAMSFLKGQQFAHSLKEAKLAQQYNPIRPALKWIQASSLLALKRPAESIPLYKEVLEKNPFSASSMTNLALAYATLKKYREASDTMKALGGVHLKRHHRPVLMRYAYNGGDYDTAEEIGAFSVSVQAEREERLKGELEGLKAKKAGGAWSEKDEERKQLVEKVLGTLAVSLKKLRTMLDNIDKVRKHAAQQKAAQQKAVRQRARPDAKKRAQKGIINIDEQVRETAPAQK